MKHTSKIITLISLILLGLSGCNESSKKETTLDPELVAKGKEIFRFDTFGDEQLWTDTLQLHNVVAGAVDPITALSVGLKVDSEVLPAGVLQTVDLTDPATTITLLKFNAVVGLQGDVQEINGKDTLVSLGTTCALCHSTVDDSVAPGIGKRLDGWANRDLNPGVILSLSPALQDQATQDVLLSWGAGKYDAYWNQDGLNDPTVIPPAYGLKDVALATYTGEGSISYWNAYVAVTQMGAQGNFVDDRLGLNIMHDPDLVTDKLPALEAYQFSLNAPKAPAGSFDSDAATRGKVVFNNQGNCSACHSGDNFTDADTQLHYPDVIGTDPMLASRSLTGKYRTTPLAGAWQHPPYFHDGSAATLLDVVEHYNNHFALGLMPSEKDDLVQYLLSL
jgi:mono/diheme cytochrome c family protein